MGSVVIRSSLIVGYLRSYVVTPYLSVYFSQAVQG